MSKSISTTRGRWFIQRKQRRKGWYCEVIWREGKKVTFSVALGYLDDAEKDAALSRLRAWGGRILAPVSAEPVGAVRGIDGKPMSIRSSSPAAGSRLLTREEIKHLALTDTSVEHVLEALRTTEAEEKIREGKCGELTLRAFVDEVYGPVRQANQSRRNWKRERSMWDQILRELGTVLAPFGQGHSPASLSRRRSVDLESFNALAVAFKPWPRSSIARAGRRSISTRGRPQCFPSA